MECKVFLHAAVSDAEWLKRVLRVSPQFEEGCVLFQWSEDPELAELRVPDLVAKAGRLGIGFLGRVESEVLAYRLEFAAHAEVLVSCLVLDDTPFLTLDNDGELCAEGGARGQDAVAAAKLYREIWRLADTALFRASTADRNQVVDQLCAHCAGPKSDQWWAELGPLVEAVSRLCRPGKER